MSDFVKNEQKHENMKKLINNLIYDTDKSEMILETVSPKKIHVILFIIQKNGRYFETFGKDDINPISEIKVKQILFNSGEENKCIEMFGEFEDA